MPKRTETTSKRKFRHISPEKAHERAVKAWRTKHARYRYGIYRLGMQPHRMSGDADLPEGTDSIQEHDNAVDNEDLAQEQALRALQEERLGTISERRGDKRDAHHRARQKRRQPQVADIPTKPKLGPARESASPPKDSPEWTHIPGSHEGDAGPLTQKPREVRGSGRAVVEHIDRLEKYSNEMEGWNDYQKEMFAKHSFVKEINGKPYTFFPHEEGYYFAWDNPNITVRKPDRFKVITHDPSTGLAYDEPRRVGIYNDPKVVLDDTAAAKGLTREELLELQERRMRSYREKKGDLHQAYTEAHERDRAEGYWRAQHDQVKEQAVRNKNRYAEGNVTKGYAMFSNDGKYGTKPGGNDFGLDAAEQRVIKLKQWELVDDTHANREAKDKIRIRFNEDVPLESDSYTDDLGERVEIKQGFKDVLDEHGLSGARIDQTENGEWIVTSAEGKRINPAHADQIALALEEKFDVKSVKRDGPAMRMKQKVIGVNDFDGTPRDDVAYDAPRSTMGTRMGEREIIKDADGKIVGLGELKDGEVDRLAVNVKLPGTKKDQKLYVNLQERSDSIGFGGDYRPGEKQLNDVLTARAKNRYLSEAHEAYLRSTQGDDTLLEKLVLERHPDIVDPDGIVNDEELAERKKQVKELGEAGIASGAYAMRNRAKNQWPSQLAHKSERVGSWADRNAVPFISYEPDAELFIKPIGQKMDEAIWRVMHPLSNPRHPSNPIEVALPEVPKRWRQRRYFSRTHPEGVDRKSYLRELKKDDALINLAQQRHKLRENLADATLLDDNAPRTARAKRKYTLMSSNGMIVKSQAIDFDRRWAEFTVKYSNMEPEQRATYNRMLGFNAEADITKMTDPGVTTDLGATRTRLVAETNAGAKYDAASMKYLKRAGRVGKYGLAAGAVAGAGVYAYDKYRGAHPVDESKPKLREKIPEKISYPSADLKVTRRRTIPTNAFTDALDIGGEKLPVAWRVAKKENTVIQIRNRKDVSGETYRSGKLIGDVDVHASTVKGVENDGSWSNSIAYTQKTEKGREIEKPGSVVIKGKELPIHFRQSEKNRYKRGDLSTNNPNKLDQEQREKIALTIIKNGPMSREFEYEYGDDPKIAEMVADERQREALRRKYDYLHIPNQYGARLGSVNEGTRLVWEPVSGPGGDARQLPDGSWIAPKHDAYGNPVTESAYNQSSKPYKEGRFGMSQSEQEYYLAEAEAAYWGSQAQYGDTFGKTIEYTQGGRYTANADKRSRPGRSPVIAKDTLPKSVAETALAREDRKRNRYAGRLDSDN